MREERMKAETRHGMIRLGSEEVTKIKGFAIA